MSKISELSDGGSLQSTDYLIAVRSGGNVKVRPNGAVSGTTGQFSTSLNVDGTVTADGLTVAPDANRDLSIAGYGTYSMLLSNSTADSGGVVSIRSNGGIVVESTGSGVNVLKAAGNGDISFYEDTGTTPKFFWDASAERLGLGTTSPDALLHVSGNNPAFKITDTSTAGSILLQPDISSSGADRITSDVNNLGIFTSAAAKYILFGTEGTERARLDASGNWLVGRTSTLNSAQASIKGDSSKQALTLQTTTDTNSLLQGFDSANTLAFQVTGGGNVYASGDVGIGTTTPSFSTGTGLEIQRTTATATLRLEYTGSNGFEISAEQTQATYNSLSSLPHVFEIASVEKARLDASGNLLVGKTSSSFSVAGVGLMANNQVWATATSDNALALNRLTTDGEIAKFYKDGTTVGSIGSNGGTNLYLTSGNRGLRFNDNDFSPITSANAYSDNTTDLGRTAARFDDIYATNALIQTSDRNEKQDIAELDEAERRVALAAKGLLRKFRWISSVEEKGDDARIHFGIIAQDLQAAFEAEGLDAGRYAMFIHSTWTDEETGEERSRMGVRYSELLAFIIAAL